jgi:hypothetical protein
MSSTTPTTVLPTIYVKKREKLVAQTKGAIKNGINTLMSAFDIDLLRKITMGITSEKNLPPGLSLKVLKDKTILVFSSYKSKSSEIHLHIHPNGISLTNTFIAYDQGESTHRHYEFYLESSDGKCKLMDHTTRLEVDIQNVCIDMHYRVNFESHATWIDSQNDAQNLGGTSEGREIQSVVPVLINYVKSTVGSITSTMKLLSGTEDSMNKEISNTGSSLEELRTLNEKLDRVLRHKVNEYEEQIWTYYGEKNEAEVEALLSEVFHGPACSKEELIEAEKEITVQVDADMRFINRYENTVNKSEKVKKQVLYIQTLENRIKFTQKKLDGLCDSPKAKFVAYEQALAGQKRPRSSSPVVPPPKRQNVGASQAPSIGPQNVPQTAKRLPPPFQGGMTVIHR